MWAHVLPHIRPERKENMYPRALLGDMYIISVFLFLSIPQEQRSKAELNNSSAAGMKIVFLLLLRNKIALTNILAKVNIR